MIQGKPVVLSASEKKSLFIDKVFSVTSTYNHLYLAGWGNFSCQENWTLFFLTFYSFGGHYFLRGTRQEFD